MKVTYLLIYLWIIYQAVTCVGHPFNSIHRIIQYTLSIFNARNDQFTCIIGLYCGPSSDILSIKLQQEYDIIFLAVSILVASGQLIALDDL